MSYQAVIEVSVRNQQELEKLNASAQRLHGIIAGIKQQGDVFKNVGGAEARKLKNDLRLLVTAFAGAKDGARQFTYSTAEGTKTVNMYSKTLGGLNHQLSTFKTVSANVAVGTDTYRDSIKATNKVSNEFIRIQAKALGVATDLSRMNVQSALALGKEVPNSVQGLNFYRNALENVLDTVKIGSNDFKVLEEAISDVERRLSGARLVGQTSKTTPAAGPATRLDTVAAYQKRANYAQQIADQEYKQLVTGQQIVQAKLKENQVEDLQNRLAQASNALAENDLALAKRLTNELRAQRIVYERSNREKEALMRPTSMTAGAAESVTGTRPFGQPPVPGSPAAWMATGGVQQAEKVTQQLEAQTSLKKRINNLTGSAQILEQKVAQAKQKGIAVDEAVVDIERVILKLKDTSVDLDKAQLDLIDQELNALRNELKIRKEIAKTQATGTGTGGAGGTGAAKGGQTSQGMKTAANVALGAGFPLLFGGGPGAVLGGALGGFAPTPIAFAAQIIFSALGQGLDKFGAAAIEAGSSIRTLDTAIEHMGEKALFQSKQQAFAAKQLEEYGRFSLAASLAQSRLNNIIGVEGVNNLQKLGSETEKLSRAWAAFSLNLQNILSNVMIPAIQFLNSLLSGPKEKTGLNTPGTFVGKASLLGGSVPRPAQTQTPVAIKLSEEQIAANISAAKDLYTELADLERELNNKKRQYAEQYADMVLALSRQQYDLTEQLQRKATDTQIQALQKELDLLKKQADLRIEIARNALLGEQLDAAPGTSLQTSLRSALEEYKIRRDEIDNAAADKERRFKLEMVRLDIDNERYKLDIAKTIQRTNYDNAVKIARINEEITRQNDAVARKNYERRVQILSVELAVLRGQTLQLQAQADAALTQSDLTKDEEKYFETLKDGLVQVLKGTSEIQARQEAGKLFTVPGDLPQMGALPALSADTAGIDAANQSYERRIAALNELETVNGSLIEQDKARLELIKQINQIAIEPINSIIEGLQKQIEYQKQYAEEIEKGTVTVLAKELASIQALYEPALKLLDIEIDRLKAKAASADLSEEELDIINAQITALDNRRAKLNEAQDLATRVAGEKGSPEARLQEAVTSVRGELNDLVDPVNQIVAGADAIGTAFAESFKGIASGAMTAQEALANFFKGVADHFLEMAAKIIAKWLQLIILNTALKLFSGAASSGGGLPGFEMEGTLAGEGVFTGSGPYKFAKGGYVTGPTNALIGEGGEPEYVIPASKMRGAMARYSSGQRGSSVVNGAATAGGGGGQVIRFESTVINNVEYVTRSQAEAMSRQAAKQGAAGGYAKTMGGLRNSRATRARVGMG